MTQLNPLGPLFILLSLLECVGTLLLATLRTHQAAASEYNNSTFGLVFDSAIICANFLLVASCLVILWGTAYNLLSNDAQNARAKAAVKKVFALVLSLDILCSLTTGIYCATIFWSTSPASEATVLALTAITFVISTIVAMVVGVALLTGLAVLGMVVYSFMPNRKKSGDVQQKNSDTR